MAVRVRLLDSSDRTAVTTAARLLHEFNVEFDTPSPGVDTLVTRIGRWSNDAMFVVVASSDDSAGVGVAVVSLRPNLWFDGPVALLDDLYVRPACRNVGTGGRLLAAVRAEAGRRGVEHVEIAVDDADVDARRFYERHGFSPFDVDSGDRVALLSGPVVPDRDRMGEM